MTKIRLDKKQQLTKLCKVLGTAPKEVLNAFIPAFYRSHVMIPWDNAAFVWLLDNGIVREDGFVLFDENPLQQALNYECNKRRPLSHKMLRLMDLYYDADT